MQWRAVWRRGWAVPVGVLACLGLLAGGRPAWAGEAYSVEKLATFDRKKDQVQPRVSGSWIVWKDYRSLSLRAVDDSPNAAIFARDLTTKTEIDVAQTRDAGDPAISGTIVVWTAGGGKTTEIQGVDLLDGQIFSVSASPGRQEKPAVDGTLIVWQDNRDGNWDIYMRDLAENGDVPVVQQAADQQRPAVSGRTIVWEDWRSHGAGPDIFAYDLDTQREKRLTDNHDASSPVISGPWVVWVGLADQGVFARNLDDGRQLRLSTAPGPKSQPAISGNIVLWTDERNGDRDVYGYDLAAGREFVVARGPEAQDDPAIDGTTIVWSDARGPNRDVVAAEVTLPATPGTTAAAR